MELERKKKYKTCLIVNTGKGLPENYFNYVKSFKLSCPIKTFELIRNLLFCILYLLYSFRDIEFVILYGLILLLCPSRRQTCVWVSVQVSSRVFSSFLQ